METTEEFYGSGAITGTAEDALKGRDVEITTTNDTQQITVKTDQEVSSEETKTEAAKETKEEEKTELTPEEKLQADVNQTIKADEDVQKELTGKGVDFQALATEYETNGTLTAESLAALEKAGYPRSVVDAYIAGLEATAEKFTNTVFGFAGGQEEFVKLSQFVQGLGKTQVDTFNKIVQTGDLNQIQIAVEGYKAKMIAKYGSANPSVLGGGGPQTKMVGFATKAEMVTAMSDPKYGRDKAYTAEVKAKVGASKFL